MIENLIKVLIVVIGTFVWGFIVGKSHYETSEKKELIKLDSERLKLSIQKLNLELNKNK